MRVAHDCCDYEEASGNADQVVSTSDRKPSACSPGHRDHVVTCPVDRLLTEFGFL